MFVLFVMPNQKRYTISFSNALTRGNFGTILNVIGAFYQINTVRLSSQNVKDTLYLV